MFAVRLHSFGTPADLRYESLDEPHPAADEIRVRVASAGVNPIDWKTCQGGGARPFIGELPWIPGWECAGVVDAVGSGVVDFKRGDRVMGLLNFPQPGRCYAEQVCAPAAQWALVPAPVSLVEAGGLPLAGTTAAQALFEHGQLTAGARVLILAAAGGVGHLAVQLAAAHQCEVSGTASTSNHDWLCELGCQTPIDYRIPLRSSEMAPFDLILDAVGGNTAIDALGVLKPTGRMITLPSITAEQVISSAQAQGKTALPMRVAPDAARLTQLGELMGEDKLRLLVGGKLPLEEVAKAHAASAAGHQRGKLLLTP